MTRSPDTTPPSRTLHLARFFALFLALFPPAGALATGGEDVSPVPSPPPTLVRSAGGPAEPAPRSLREAASGVRLNRGALDGWNPRPGDVSPGSRPDETTSRPTFRIPPALRVEGTSFSGPDKSGNVSVSGRVRNDGMGPACEVIVALVAYDERTQEILGQSEIRTKLRSVAPFKTASFHGTVRIPPGTGPSEAFFRGKSYTAPNWKHRLGRVEASVASGNACP